MSEAQLDPHGLDDVALDIQAEDVAGVRANFCRVVGELDAARFAAAADVDLRFDHDRIADPVGDSDRVFDGLSRRRLTTPECQTGRRTACPEIPTDPRMILPGARPFSRGLRRRHNYLGGKARVDTRQVPLPDQHSPRRSSGTPQRLAGHSPGTAHFLPNGATAQRPQRRAGKEPRTPNRCSLSAAARSGLTCR